ncbi:hypothetical protein WIS52_28070 [Pseudonocardia nematodicida]|uniref:Uncharacterized protein n=1 Tax=Pseudonocardia nematodicida TaxID=1206997 RepID=A0ABV1KIQ6_9PSEU
MTTRQGRPSRPGPRPRGAHSAATDTSSRTDDVRAVRRSVPVLATGLEPFWPSRRAPLFNELCR